MQDMTLKKVGDLHICSCICYLYPLSINRVYLSGLPMLGLLFLWHVLFVAFFVAIGVRWLWFVPLFGMVVFFLYSQEASADGQVLSKESISTFLSRHAFAFAWCCIMLGGRGIATMWTIDTRTVSGSLVLINIVLWLLSYAFDYEDGKEMFHVGYYVGSFVFLGSVWSLADAQTLWELSMAWVAMTMAVYAFIVFIGGALGKKIHHSLTYPLFVTINLCLLFLIYRWTNNDIALSLVLGQIYLMALYCCIWRVWRWHETVVDPYVDEDEELFRSILSGKRLYKSKLHLPVDKHLLQDLWQFISRLNVPTKFVISFLNILLVLGQVIFFVQQMGSGAMFFNELLLWFGIVSFFVNYLLLRQIGFTHGLQRVLAFILINFGIYLTIINLFGSDVVYIVGLGMIWSLINSLAMFHTWWLLRRSLLQPQDYFYWIGANTLAVICNLYFLYFLPLSAQFRFFLALIYFGTWLFLTLYNLKFMRGKL